MIKIFEFVFEGILLSTGYNTKYQCWYHLPLNTKNKQQNRRNNSYKITTTITRI